MIIIASLVALFSDNVLDITEQQHLDQMLAKRVEVAALGAVLPAFQVKGQESAEFLAAKRYLKENNIKPFEVLNEQ